MPVPTSFTDLSTTPASNSPPGSESPTDGDNYLRTIFAMLRSIMSNSGNGWTSPYLAPAGSGASLTALNATQLTSGTVPDARLNATLQVATSGTYTPTLTAVANCSGLTSAQAQYMRVGSVVTVSGSAGANETSVSTLSRVGVSLPIASAFSSTVQCSGAGAGESATGLDRPVSIFADATNDRAEIRWEASGSGTAINLYFTFTYVVV